MEEPARYKKDSMKHAKIPYWLILKRYGGSLAAISATWFLYDIITYACFRYYPRIKFTPLSLGILCVRFGHCNQTVL
jgi:hypothetical protein